jgi:hypothetical protein
MLFNPLHANADDSIRRIFESLSIATNFSDWHLSVNDTLMISTEKGTHRQPQLCSHRAERGLDDCLIIPFFTVTLRRHWFSGSWES